MDGTAEEHLRIGALEDAGDAGAPLELLLDPPFFSARESPLVKDLFFNA